MSDGLCEAVMINGLPEGCDCDDCREIEDHLRQYDEEAGITEEDS